MTDERWGKVAGPPPRTWDEFRSAVLELAGMVGVSEIAERAGVKHDTVMKWRIRHADFPEPAAELAMGPVWFWPDVEPWVTAQLENPSKGGRPRSS